MHQNATTVITNGTISKSPSIVTYFEILIRNKRIIELITIAALITSIIISLLMPPIYISTARILPPQNDNNLLGMMMGQMSGGVTSLANDILANGTSSDLYASILTSETIKDKIIDQFKLLDVYEEKFRLDAYKKLGKTVIIDVGKKDGIISISVADKNPKLSADMANAYVEELGKLAAGLSSSKASQNRHFLEERLIKTRYDLTQAEEILKNFELKNKVPDISEQSKGTIKGIADIMAQLALEEVKLSALKQQFTDSSHEVKVEKTVVRNLKEQIARLEGLGNGGAIPGIKSIPTISQEYIRLMRNFKTQEMILELLTKQYEIAKYTEANSVSTLQIIQKATVPDKKARPKRTVLVIISTLAGFLFSIFYISVLEYFNFLPPDEQKRWRNVLSGLRFWKPSNSK